MLEGSLSPFQVALVLLINLVDIDSTGVLVALEHLAERCGPATDLFISIKRRRTVGLSVNQRNC